MTNACGKTVEVQPENAAAAPATTPNERKVNTYQGSVLPGCCYAQKLWKIIALPISTVRLSGLAQFMFPQMVLSMDLTPLQYLPFWNIFSPFGVAAAW